MKRVILLSGHNFEKKGCYNRKLDVSEFDVATEVIAEVFSRERLKHVDLVLKARNDFSNLVKEVNSLNGDLLISMHFNAYNGKAQGTETLIALSSKTGAKYAPKIQEILVKHLGLNDRGINPTSAYGRGGSILNKTKPVAFLLEPFFLDEVENLKELEEYKNATADAVLEILEWYEQL